MCISYHHDPKNFVPVHERGLTRVQKVRKLEVQEGRAVCPVCGRKTQTEILPDTILKNFPLFCKKCGQTTVVNTESLSLGA
ncbi:MAG: cysteine-rich KTR domain-containing protein [Oscillospiraceae bacterium]